MLVAVALACDDSFTETVEVGALSDDALQNETGINLLLVGTYSALDGVRNNASGAVWTGSGDNWWLDALSDDAHKGSTDSDQAELYQMEIFDWGTANPYILGKWTALYAGVNRANNVLSVIGKVTEGDFTAQEAEARFLRAHFNFELQRIFGNVSFISVDNFNNQEFNQPNSGPIWDQIEADFQFAIDNLPAERSTKPSVNVAKAYKGKVHLYQSEWAEAATLFNDVITSGDYGLLPEFVDNFRLAGDNSIESLFAIQFTADSGSSFNGNQAGTLNFPNAFGFCCGFYQPSQDLVNAFQVDDDGLPLLDTFNQNNDVKNDYNLISFQVDGDGNVIEDADGNPIPTAFTPEEGELDPRLDYTVGRRGIDYNKYGTHIGKDWIRANFSDISGPYLAKKNIYQKGEDANAGTGGWGQQHSGINYHIIRYADVLLMAAEAAVETNNLGTALTYINEVRMRAKNMTPVQNEAGTGPAANYSVEPYTAFADQETARKAVRHERRLELGMEGHRLFDIRRWGNGVEIMNAYFDNEARVITSFSDDPRPYEERHNLLPIPLTAIDLSGGTLTQNPGF